MRTSSRLLIIAQLSFVFGYLCWVALKPPMEEHYRETTLRLLHQAVEEPFEESDGVSFSQRLEETAFLLIEGTPAYAKGWCFFSLATCLLLLFSIKGARKTAWLLPLLAALYGWENQQVGVVLPPAPDAKLFPQEEQLYPYLDEPLSDSIHEQYPQLKEAWERYLVDEWGSEANFTRARIRAYEESEPLPRELFLRAREPLPLIIFYLLWNLGFAAWFTIKEK